MRIARRDNSWWIIDVPSSVASGERFTSCGPYATKADAADDKLGLERFFVEHPVCETCLPGFPQRPTPSRSRASHWFIRSLEFKPLKFRKPKPFRYSTRQKMLPGFEA